MRMFALEKYEVELEDGRRKTEDGYTYESC